MPQITVNEIDQSVVTRVVSDDRVKILVPAILSFGPTNTGDVNSVMTFTDVTDFNRKCGGAKFLHSAKISLVLARR